MSKDKLNQQKPVEFNSIGEYVSALNNGGSKSLPAVNIYEPMCELFPEEMQGIKNPMERVQELKEQQEIESQKAELAQNDNAAQQEGHSEAKEPPKKKRSWWQKLIGYRNEPKESESRMSVDGTHQKSDHHKQSKRYGQWWSRNYKTESKETNHYDLHPLTKTSFTETVESTEESYLWGLFSKEKRKYSGGGIDQETGTIKLLWGLIQYENDWHPMGITDKQGLGDGGDRFRTAKLTIGADGLFKFGFRLGTGDPGMIPEGGDETDYRNIDWRRGPNGYYAKSKNGDDPDKYRMGQAFIEIGGHRIGVNSEKVRALIQHTVHWAIGDHYFNVLDDNVEVLNEKRKYH